MKFTFSFVLALFLKWNELTRETSGRRMHNTSSWCLCMQILSSYEKCPTGICELDFQIKRSLKKFCIFILLMLEATVFESTRYHCASPVREQCGRPAMQNPFLWVTVLVGPLREEGWVRLLLSWCGSLCPPLQALRRSRSCVVREAFSSG